MLLALVPALIVIPQPDLGTGMVYVAVGFAILFFAGTSWKQLTALVALFVVSITFVLVGAPAMGVHVSKPYQVQRLDRIPQSVARPAQSDLQHHSNR